MIQVEIDFDVYKALTSLRPDEHTTYNDVLRELLKLPPQSKPAPPSPNDSPPWIVDDVRFPGGSEFVAIYKGVRHTAVVKDGQLELTSGHRFASPSAAAMHITGTQVNGWRFWQCKRPGDTEFVPIDHLRSKTH